MRESESKCARKRDEMLANAGEMREIPHFAKFAEATLSSKPARSSFTLVDSQFHSPAVSTQTICQNRPNPHKLYFKSAGYCKKVSPYSYTIHIHIRALTVFVDHENASVGGLHVQRHLLRSRGTCRLCHTWTSKQGQIAESR